MAGRKPLGPSAPEIRPGSFPRLCTHLPWWGQRRGVGEWNPPASLMAAPPLGEDPLRPGLVGCWGRKAAVCSGAGGVEGSKSRIKEQLLGPGGWAGGAALLFAFCICGSLHSPSPADILSQAGGQHRGRGPGLQPREQVQGCGSLPWEALTGVPMHLLGQALHGHLPTQGPWPSLDSSSQGIRATSAPSHFSCSCRGLPAVRWVLQEPWIPGCLGGSGHSHTEAAPSPQGALEHWAL